MERFNLKGFRRFWAIAKSYWFGDEKWKAGGLLLLIAVFLLGYTGLSVVLNNKRGVLISALSAKDEARFWETVLVFVGVLIAYAPLMAGYDYLQKRLGLEWRRWLTGRFVADYFGDRAFYDIQQFHPDIDNPDQRIAEDVRNFTQQSLALLLVVVSSVLQVIAFSGVLWGISKNLVGFLVLYALLGTLVTVVIFGQPLVRLNFEQLKREANFRFSLVRIRENAEAIAFYRGEAQEASQVNNRFMAAFDNFKKLIVWELNLNALTNAYEFIPFVLPAIVVAPAVFSGDLEVGKVSEAQGAFVRVFFSLNVVVARFSELTSFGAGIDRLYSFAEALNHLEPEAAAVEDSSATVDHPTAEVSPDSSDHTTIAIETSASLALKQFTLQTPNYQRTLVENLSIDIPDKTGLLIVGPSGCGKSSLLRAIAGLWHSGSGTIYRPELDNILFLPQKPYMILGTLREQLLYPNTSQAVGDADLQTALEKVNLANLAERFGGFDAVEEWGDVLSLGEQQRLTFARILVSQPEFAILDEATSALDLANEAKLYDHLHHTGTTFVSVGHRESLVDYHQTTLALAEDHTWVIKPSSLATADL
ncbi:MULTISPECIES: ABC transporter ATP-binding protein/permease [Cyanophyceae]|uniref:ABC transporter ATP-binding protein/permease n=1 Tax=Cyanophyceae TaxID=3028117 RepID=UPI0016893C1F|nr:MULTISPECIES: ABC transporter ATP-binding protein/permease [Cyanophyceae]MBD1917363.1 ABC transporter ATP-binding protein/permease [Phormidium sp. FACHB-77]MBD2032287.1 ABC transporter ATP-binding protein/permease [Phormidium sp. FACHB-322]MBD2053324.1 ABC transporter ATP-binding protein/permease [Leptolyngbya sp. FACHB-60]